MKIQVMNYNTSVANKSLVASFDIIVGCWIIRDLKLFEKNGKKWVLFPSKPVKSKDGTWGIPIPYCELTTKDTWYRMQAEILAEIKQMKSPSKIHENENNHESEYYPGLWVKKKEKEEHE